MKYFVAVDEARQDSVSLFLQPHLDRQDQCQARVFDFKTRLFQYVYITSTMSSEKHLEEDTGELSESEALLGYAPSTTVLPEPRSPTLDRLAGHCRGDLSAITKRLKELANQKVPISSSIER
jgi:hypothetical protein